MERSILKKLKLVLIAFTVLAIPMSYVIIASIKMDNANEAYKEVMINDGKKIDLAIQKINNAQKIVFWKNNLTNQKAELLYKKKEYRKVLNCIGNTKAYLYKSLIYEHLNKSDSAKIFYEKEIPLLKERLSKCKNDAVLSLQIERQIALVYTFLGEKENASKYLKKIPNDFYFYQRRMIQEYDFYIEDYKSGGYKNYLEGETVIFGIDSLTSNIDIDSLFDSNRFYYNGYTSFDGEYEFKIKKIFEKKALSIGMNKIEKTKPNTRYSVWQ
ncbi:hypothetical protein [Saccharicrinis sp. FJH54]|uniref:hypothetical protein n=1 Tax=Saccharicrinis sp. FJH54 TaxID=3344665 RepID=UPI0035D510BD